MGIEIAALYYLQGMLPGVMQCVRINEICLFCFHRGLRFYEFCGRRSSGLRVEVGREMIVRSHHSVYDMWCVVWHCSD